MFKTSDTSPANSDLHAAPGADLGDLARLAIEIGASAVAAEADAVARRVAEGRFYVACVGQFKRGKSTLLNALTGSEVLPAGVLPVTSVPTIVRFGERLGARVRFASGSWRDIPPEDLAAYVSEERNSENKIGVEAVEVFVPSPLLSSGMCLVDTPGIGSVFAGNTMTTREFVPHVDAAIVVLGADPPISGEELSLVEEVSRHVENLFFVLNKADRLPADESNEAARFAERVLKERLGARVQNDLIERVRESRRRCEAEIRARLSDAVRSATSALERAKERRAEGDASVAAELRRLGDWRLRAQQIGGAG